MIKGFQGTYKDIDFFLRKEFAQNGRHVTRSEWQALRDDRPQMSTVELYDISVDMKVPTSIELWQHDCQPNLPWAEDHFAERVGGVPLNPGEQYKNWPWYEGGVEEHKGSGKFSHTYMERMWDLEGNLGHVVELLAERPMTRQAYLTIWWPLDVVQSLDGERVPCSLGYLFQYQDGGLHCYYYLRSCDFIRYMWDDIYMAGRLLQWVAGEDETPDVDLWLHTKIANLHIFQPEFRTLETDYQTKMQERLASAF